MVIGVDLRPINTGEKSGVEEYTINLLSHLFFIDKKNQYKLFLNSFSAPKLNFKKLELLPNVKLYFFSYPNKILNSAFVFLKYPRADEMLKGIDLFFSPNLIFTNLSPQCKQIVTFHDLSFERHPEFFSWKRRLWHQFVLPRSAAQRAAGIIAVSSSTRFDLEKLYKIPRRKIRVIHSGILKRFKPRSRNHPFVVSVRQKYNLPPHFILYLGTLEPRKNLEGLILAFNEFKRRYKTQYKLVIAGRPGWMYRNVYKLAGKSPFSRDIMFIGFISVQHKPYLYNLADLFVYPSFYEGFGFPPLEAMASGVPVLSSNISSLPEVIGEAGILIDPYNVNEISEGIKFVLFNSRLKDRLIKKGITRAAEFSWSECARATLSFFEEVSPVGKQDSLTG